MHPFRYRQLPPKCLRTNAGPGVSPCRDGSAEWVPAGRHTAGRHTETLDEQRALAGRAGSERREWKAGVEAGAAGRGSVRALGEAAEGDDPDRGEPGGRRHQFTEGLGMCRQIVAHRSPRRPELDIIGPFRSGDVAEPS
jgi:hypothetical protein